MTSPKNWDAAEARRLHAYGYAQSWRTMTLREIEESYNPLSGYEPPTVESRTAGSDCSYQSDPADSRHEV